MIKTPATTDGDVNPYLPNAHIYLLSVSGFFPPIIFCFWVKNVTQEEDEDESMSDVDPSERNYVRFLRMEQKFREARERSAERWATNMMRHSRYGLVRLFVSFSKKWKWSQKGNRGSGKKYRNW